MLAIDSVHHSSSVSTRIIAVNDSGLDILKEQINLNPDDLLVRSERRGYLGAMDAGVKAATSPFVGFLDSDDIIHPSKIAIQLEEMLLNDRDLVACKIVKFSKEPSEFVDFHVLGNLPTFLNPSEKLIFGAYGADSSILIRRDVLQKTWSSHAKYPSHLADYGWLLENIQEMNVGYIPEPLYFYRSHSLQMSRNSDLANEWKHLHKLWVRNLLILLPLTSHVLAGISEEMSRSIAFPLSFPKLSFKERRKVIEILKVIRRELSYVHLKRNREVRDFINLRIVLLEFCLNPLHFISNFRLLSYACRYLVNARGIKRR